MKFINITYIVCFVFIYFIPMMIILRRLKILPELRELNHLITSPQYDKDKNVISIKSNITDFSNKYAGIMRKNYIFKILLLICNDINNGKKYNPMYYLSLHKNYINRSIGYIFLFSHLAPLLLFIFMFEPFDYFIDLMIFRQFIWYILIIALHQFLIKKYNSFTEIFYSRWFNTLLNYDLLSINALKEKLFHETYFITPEEIKDLLIDIQNSFKEPLKTLMISSEKLFFALEKLSNDIQNENVITSESIIKIFDDNINKSNELCLQMENITSLTKGSQYELLKYVENNKIDINTINSLSNELSNLRKYLLAFMENHENVAIENLSNVTYYLETNINKTFEAIEDTLKANTEKLSKSYDNFFELCKLLTEKTEN